MNPQDGEPARTSGNAIQLLRDLRLRWGIQGAEVDGWKTAPTIIRVKAMDYLETWRKHEHSLEPAKTVLLTKYELIEKERTDGATKTAAL